jgi:hypothetical protein
VAVAKKGTSKNNRNNQSKGATPAAVISASTALPAPVLLNVAVCGARLSCTAPEVAGAGAGRRPRAAAAGQRAARPQLSAPPAHVHRRKACPR